jgi:hypothetical protein
VASKIEQSPFGNRTCLLFTLKIVSRAKLGQCDCSLENREKGKRRFARAFASQQSIGFGDSLFALSSAPAPLFQ